MPVRDADDARRWAKREHETILRMQALCAEHGDKVMWRNTEREARSKRGHALMSLRCILNDRSVPETGTDEEISAYLGVTEAPKIAPCPTALLARREGGGA